MSKTRFFICWILAATAGACAGQAANTAWVNVALTLSLITVLLIGEAIANAVVARTPQENPNE